MNGVQGLRGAAEANTEDCRQNAQESQKELPFLCFLRFLAAIPLTLILPTGWGAKQPNWACRAAAVSAKAGQSDAADQIRGKIHANTLQ